ncbi:MAG: DUF2993 domain-containing protein [Synechococcales cyanobacterium M58_A2018_015]|nr:DUF2993 domain-containing protein [Synechococcales cyanobacterium M58_A2018_015]
MNNANNEGNLTAQALDKLAEVAITSQLDTVEQVDVTIDTDPGKLIAGKVDSVAIAGEGLVMKQELRVEAMAVTTGAVEINPLKAIFGEIELTHPTDAHVQILLTEADINRALQSDFLRNKMQNLSIEVQGQPRTLTIQSAQVSLPGDNQLVIEGALALLDTAQIKQVTATTKPFLKEAGHCIGLEVMSVDCEGLALDFVMALVERITDLLDLRNFELDGMSIRLQDFNLETGKLLLRGVAQVETLPT